MEYRKREGRDREGHEEISGELGRASELIGAGEYAAALGVLDEVAGKAEGAERRCQVATMVGRVEYEQGRFGEAAESYAGAAELGESTGEAWFGAALGEVRARLGNVEVEAAFTAGQAALARARAGEAEFAAAGAAAGAAVAAGAEGRIERGPVRGSVAAFRLGQQFWEQGEPEKALWFYERAREMEPGGACRARIAIAEVALLEEDFEGAAEGAKAALRLGHYHAKTLSAWPVLIAANRRLGRPGVDPGLLGGLAQARPAVRGRARLVIARTLRSYDDPAWAEFAGAAAGEDPRFILRAEFAKMEVASASEDEAAGAAAQLLATPNLGPQEWLSAAKATLAAQLGGGQAPRPGELIARGIARYGEGARGWIVHGLALASQKAGRPGLGIALLTPVVTATARPASAWLLGQLEAGEGDLAAAIGRYAALAARSDIPARFRLLATLEWARLVVQTGDASALAAAGPPLAAAARELTDYELLLDLARQMTLAPGEIAAQAGGVFERGQTLARQAFAAQSEPGAALEILFKLARRQSDFGAYGAIAQGWEELPEARRDWLWSRGGLYWQYLALVAGAYRATARLPAADALAEKYLEDAATPAIGLAELGIPHALSRLARGEREGAFGWFEWITGQAPTHVLCAYAYYWLALRAKKAGDEAGAQSRLPALRLALGTSLGLSWMKDLSARAQLLAGVDPAELAAGTEFSGEDLQAQQAAIAQDLAKL